VSHKNESTLGSCSFDKHALILIIFSRQHQHTFRNYTHFLPSLLLTLLAFKQLQRKWCNTGNLKQRLIEHGKRITKCRGRSWWSMEKVVMCMRKSGRTSAKIKPALFRGTDSFQSHQQSTEENVLCFASFPSQLFKSK